MIRAMLGAFFLSPICAHALTAKLYVKVIAPEGDSNSYYVGYDSIDRMVANSDNFGQYLFCGQLSFQTYSGYVLFQDPYVKLSASPWTHYSFGEIDLDGADAVPDDLVEYDPLQYLRNSDVLGEGNTANLVIYPPGTGFTSSFDIYLDAYVNGASPATYIVKYQVRNQTQEPVNLVVSSDQEANIDSAHWEPVTETEGQATTVHEVIFQGGTHNQGIVHCYQDSTVLQMGQADFVYDGLNYVAEGIVIDVYKAPDPVLHLSCTAMNGTSSSANIVATVTTSMGVQVLTIGSVGGGSYYAPFTETYTHDVDLEEGEVPLSVVFSMDTPTNSLGAVSPSISLPNDDYEYYASGVLNVSGVPDVENPNPSPDPDDPDDPSDPNPNPTPPSTPPAPQPGGDPVDYELMAQAMEFALNNQKVSGVNDSVQNLTDVVKDIRDNSMEGDTSGYSGEYDIIDATNSISYTATRQSLDNLEGGFKGFFDGIPKPQFPSGLSSVSTLSVTLLGRPFVVDWSFPEVAMFRTALAWFFTVLFFFGLVMIIRRAVA